MDDAFMCSMIGAIFIKLGRAPTIFNIFIEVILPGLVFRFFDPPMKSQIAR